MRVLGRVFEGRLREIRANLVVQCRLHLLQPCYCGKDQTIGELIWQTLTRMGHWTLQSSENSCLMNSTATNNGKNMLLLLQNPAQGRFRAFSWVWSGEIGRPTLLLPLYRVVGTSFWVLEKKLLLRGQKIGEGALWMWNAGYSLLQAHLNVHLEGGRRKREA